MLYQIVDINNNIVFLCLNSLRFALFFGEKAKIPRKLHNIENKINGTTKYFNVNSFNTK